MVLSAALAIVTKRIALRAGSVVLSIQHPTRVAEEWAVVDRLSKGRVGLSFTSGWMPNDFIFFPHHFATKRDVMFHGIEESVRSGVASRSRCWFEVAFISISVPFLSCFVYQMDKVELRNKNDS